MFRYIFGTSHGDFTEDRLMSEAQLRAWLRRPRDRDSSAGDERALLAADAETIPDLTRRALGFVFALLRDIYPDDADARAWLTRATLHDSESPIDMLRGGRVADVETLLVRQWNQGVRLPPRPRHLRFAWAGERSMSAGAPQRPD